MRIYLCRHGETIMNAESRWQGQCDSPLTEIGVLQSKEIAKYFGKKKIEAIFTSTLNRAKATALPLRKRFPTAPYFELAVLKEINNGEADGLIIEETKKKYPHLIDRINLRDLRSSFPGGESYDDVVKRLLPFVEELKKNYAGKNVAIIGHGGINRMLLRILFKLSNEETIQISTHHDIIYEIYLSKDKPKIFNVRNGKKKKGFVSRQ